MGPIRVLQVVTTLERAGLETMLMNYYRHMDRDKVQFDFLRHRDGIHAYDDEICAMGGRIYTVPPFNPLNTNGYLSMLDNFFAEHKEYRIVHSHLDCLSSVPLRYAKKNGVPIRIAHSHVSKMTFDLKYPVRMLFRSQIPFVATDLFACSKAAGKWMYGGYPFQLVTNAIDSNAFSYDETKAKHLRKEMGLEGKFVVVHVGRFDAVKNHSFLLDVFQEIEKIHSNSILLLAGVGETMDAIKERTREYGLEDKVHFLGSVKYVPDLLPMADVFVFPSLYEGLGISLIEAQAAGLPCFASEDRVPKDANVTGTVNFLKLDCGAKKWAERIVEIKGQAHQRNSNMQLLSDCGYDITKEAEKLQTFYIQKSLEDA